MQGGTAEFFCPKDSFVAEEDDIKIDIITGFLSTDKFAYPKWQQSFDLSSGVYEFKADYCLWLYGDGGVVCKFYFFGLTQS